MPNEVEDGGDGWCVCVRLCVLGEVVSPPPSEEEKNLPAHYTFPHEPPEP